MASCPVWWFLGYRIYFSHSCSERTCQKRNTFWSSNPYQHHWYNEWMRRCIHNRTILWRHRVQQHLQYLLHHLRSLRRYPKQHHQVRRVLRPDPSMPSCGRSLRSDGHGKQRYRQCHLCRSHSLLSCLRRQWSLPSCFRPQCVRHGRKRQCPISTIFRHDLSQSP